MANTPHYHLTGYSRKPGFSFQLNYLLLLASVLVLAFVFFVQAYRQPIANTVKAKQVPHNTTMAQRK